MKNGVGHNKGRGSKDNKYLMLNWFRVSYQFCLLWSAAQRLPNEIEMLKITKSIKNEHTHTLNTESPGQPKRKPTQRDAEATLSTLQRLEDKSVRCTQLSHATSSLGPGRASGANLITSHNVREHSLSLSRSADCRAACHCGLTTWSGFTKPGPSCAHTVHQSILLFQQVSTCRIFSHIQRPRFKQNIFQRPLQIPKIISHH